MFFLLSALPCNLVFRGELTGLGAPRHPKSLAELALALLHLLHACPVPLLPTALAPLLHLLLLQLGRPLLLLFMRSTSAHAPAAHAPSLAPARPCPGCSCPTHWLLTPAAAGLRHSRDPPGGHQTTEPPFLPLYPSSFPAICCSSPYSPLFFLEASSLMFSFSALLLTTPFQGFHSPLHLPFRPPAQLSCTSPHHQPPPPTCPEDYQGGEGGVAGGEQAGPADHQGPAVRAEEHCLRFKHLQCALCSVQRAACSVQRAVFSVKCTVCSRFLQPRPLGGIWIGQNQYRLPLAPLNEYPEPWW